MSNPWDFSQTMIVADQLNEQRNQNMYLNQYRDMQMKQMAQDLKEKQALEEVRRGGANYLTQNQALLNPTTINTTVPNYNQSMGLYQPPAPQQEGMPMDFGGNSYEVPADQTISKTLPARETELSLLGKYYTKAGYPEKGIPMQKEAMLEKQNQMKEVVSILETSRKLAVGGNEKAASMFVDAAKEAYPMLKDVEFKFDKQTGISTVQKELPNGLVITQAYDVSGKELGKPHYENKTTKETDADAKKREGFEALYPQWKGQVGTPQYAAAFRDYTNKTQEKLNITVQGRMAGGEAFAKTRGPTVWDTQEKRAIPMTWYEYSDKYENEPGRYIAMSDPKVTEMQGAAKQRTGMRAANVTTASQVFDQEMPELIRLRNSVQKKGLLPSGGLKDMNALNLWIGKKVNDPDVAELQKKTKLMADALQRTIGGTQGGQWAFEVAADILDPSYAPPAFERIFKSHSKSLQRMATAYKEFGNENLSAPGGGGGRFKILKVE